MSFPSIGFPDGQRVDSRDATDAVWTISGTFNSNQLSPIIPTQGYDGTFIAISGGSGTFLLEVVAYLDDAGVTPLASQSVMVDANIGDGFYVCFPNVGPYVQLLALKVGGLSFSASPLIALLTNKVRPLSALTLEGFWKPTVSSIPALTSATLYSPFYFLGNTWWHVNSGGTACIFTLQAEDTAGNWQSFAQLAPAASALLDEASVTWPLAPVRLVVTNTSGTTANSTWSAVSVPNLGS